MPRVNTILWSVGIAFILGMCASPLMMDFALAVADDGAASDTETSTAMVDQTDPSGSDVIEEILREAGLLEEPIEEETTVTDMTPIDLTVSDDMEVTVTETTEVAIVEDDTLKTTDAPVEEATEETVEEETSPEETFDANTPLDEEADDSLPAEPADNTLTEESTPTEEPVTEGAETNENTESVTAEPAKLEPVEPPKPIIKKLTSEQLQLRYLVRYTINGYYQKPTNSRDNTAADVLQNMLAFGRGTKVLYIRRDGTYDQINVMKLLGVNYPCSGYSCLKVVDGCIAPRNGYGGQMVPGQVAAIFAQAGIPLDQELAVGKVKGTVADLVEYEKRTCRTGTDLSMKLIALSWYAADETWTNDQGQQWSIERLIEEEMKYPLAKASGNGMDRLVGMSYAMLRCENKEIPVTGQYLRAKEYLEKSQAFAIKNQSPDGTWSSRYAKNLGDVGPTLGALKSTGRMLEWLALSMPVEQLESRPMTAAVQRASELLGGSSNQYEMSDLSPRDLEGLTHALRALMIYDKRVFGPADTPEALQAARKAAMRR